MVRSFSLAVGLCFLQKFGLVLKTSLLAVELRFGLCAYGGKYVWVFFADGSGSRPSREISEGRKWGI